MHPLHSPQRSHLRLSLPKCLSLKIVPLFITNIIFLSVISYHLQLGTEKQHDRFSSNGKTVVLYPKGLRGTEIQEMVTELSQQRDTAFPEDSSSAPILPLVKPVFDSPTPHLWKDIPIIQPHTGHKKVLVTGAVGFVGSHISEFLLDRGDEVIVVDEVNDYYDIRVKEGNLAILRAKAESIAQSIPDKQAQDLLTIYKGDINDQDLMHDIFQRHQPTHVCHMAARAGVRPSIQDPLLYVRANVQGTTNMLEYSRIYNVENVVVASSSSVYGESDSTFFSEAEDVNEPVSPYAQTKRSGELISYTYHKLYKLNITNLRFFTVYGPRGRPDMAPYKFISKVTRGDEIEQYGDGTTSRDYTYIDDIVNGVVRAIDRPYPYQIFNLGKGSGTKLGEFIGLVEKHVGKKANIKFMPNQPGDVPFTNADVSKANRLLGYESSVTMEEGIKRTVAWYKEIFGEDGMGGLNSETEEESALENEGEASAFEEEEKTDINVGSDEPVWKVV